MLKETSTVCSSSYVDHSFSLLNRCAWAGVNIGKGQETRNGCGRRSSKGRKWGKIEQSGRVDH